MAPPRSCNGISAELASADQAQQAGPLLGMGRDQQHGGDDQQAGEQVKEQVKEGARKVKNEAKDAAKKSGSTPRSNS